MAEAKQHWSLKLVRPAIELITQGWKTVWGRPVVALGASGVGKTTLWTYLEQGGAAAADELDKTLQPYAVGGGRFKVRDIKVVGIELRLRAIDVPGDEELRQFWADVLRELRPRGVIFMIDHCMDGDELDARGVNPARMAEHRAAFTEFRIIVQANTDVQSSLKAVVVMANKSDIWPPGLSYGQLLQYSDVGPQLQTLKSSLSTRAERTSAKYGQGIREAVQWLAGSI